MSAQKTWRMDHPFTLESGKQIPTIEVAFHTYGTFSENKPVIWVCHALTANSDVSDWWNGLFGENDLFNHDGLTEDGIAEAFAEFAKKEKLSFFL